MPRPIQAVIHGPALANNLQVARRHAPNSRVWAVVKANAYGHGIERVYEGLRQTDGFGLLDLDEAVSCSKAFSSRKTWPSSSSSA
jgi:alanine racemase